jgi:LysR family transcriptional activator of nhaA
MMDWLNYHHLFYFWTVARSGSITKACAELRLAQPTISGQLRVLEDQLGHKLFAKVGRGLKLTDVGQTVFAYADEIFSIGREMQDTLKDRPRGRPMRLQVGISDLLPKLIAYRILEPALRLKQAMHLVCLEDSSDRLLGELAEHRLDVVLSDAPLSAQIRVKAFSHLLGSSPVAVYATAKLAAKYRRNFPRSLDGSPMLLPIDGSELRRALEHFFDAQGIQPILAGEFQDSALLKTFGKAGAGLFAAPEAIDRQVRENYSVVKLGSLRGIRESFYAISVERRLKHPAVVAISEAARNKLFAV